MAENLRQHGAGELVLSSWGHDRTTSEFVEVRAADAACQRLDQHLGIAERIRRWNVCDANILLGVKPYCFHVSFPPPVRVSVGVNALTCYFGKALPGRRRDDAKRRPSGAGRRTNATRDAIIATWAATVIGPHGRPPIGGDGFSLSQALSAQRQVGKTPIE